MKSKRRYFFIAALCSLLVFFAWGVFSRTQDETRLKDARKASPPAPVEVAPIARGPIVLRRSFSGTLEALAEFVVAPKVGGRIKALNVDLADPVRRGQVVAELDNDEHLQAVAQARADLAVARANLSETESARDIALRELQRVETLLGRGVASESQRDAAKVNHLAKQAQREVAVAQLARAESALETAKIRLRYTKITADWTGGDDQRIVAERYVDAGQTVSANAPLLLIVELDPLTGVIFVTEKDYARLRSGQSAELTTDAYPGESFTGRVERIAPVFREATRQARVEMTIENAERRLKPGMFIRASLVLEQIEEAIIVPEEALTTRNDQTGVFVVNEGDLSVAWRAVAVGIREGERVQITGEGLSGRVVTLGQQLVDDGSPVSIPDRGDAAAPEAQTAEQG